MTYVAHYPQAEYGEGLGGFLSTIKSVGSAIGKAAVTPFTASAKTVTWGAKALKIPGADTADKWVSNASLGPVNKVIDKALDKTMDVTCDALMNQYISTGLTVGLTVATSGSSLLIMQGGKQVASGACAARMAQALEAITAGPYPSGSIAYRQSDGNYRIAVPRGLGDLGAPTHVATAVVATLPAGVQEVDKATFERVTTPFYARTTFLVGASVIGAAAIVGGIVFAKRRRR